MPRTPSPGLLGLPMTHWWMYTGRREAGRVAGPAGVAVDPRFAGGMSCAGPCSTTAEAHGGPGRVRQAARRHRRGVGRRVTRARFADGTSETRRRTDRCRRHPLDRPRAVRPGRRRPPVRARLLNFGAQLRTSGSLRPRVERTSSSAPGLLRLLVLPDDRTAAGSSTCRTGGRCRRRRRRRSRPTGSRQLRDLYAVDTSPAA